MGIEEALQMMAELNRQWELRTWWQRLRGYLLGYSGQSKIAVGGPPLTLEQRLAVDSYNFQVDEACRQHRGRLLILGIAVLSAVVALVSLVVTLARG